MTETDKVLYDRKSKHLLEVQLNNPAEFNFLKAEMIDSIGANFKNWEKDSDLKVIIMKGSGMAFSVGGDVKSIYEAKVALGEKSGSPELMDTFFRREYTLDYKIATMKPLQIALWDGFVFGGGVGLSIHATFRVATEKTLFSMPEANLGFFTDASGGYFLSRLQDNLGYYLGLTGQKIKGKDVCLAGLANYFVPSEKLPELEAKLHQASAEDLSKEKIDALIKTFSEPVEGQLSFLPFVKK